MAGRCWKHGLNFILPTRDPLRVRDAKVEIPATRLESTDRSMLSFICVHLRSSDAPDMLFFRPNAKIKTQYWPQMNADKRG
jgi:hypothetical protein